MMILAVMNAIFGIAKIAIITARIIASLDFVSAVHIIYRIDNVN